ncbi:hypothetical protein C173_24942 [Paenibacillus sp. FSL R7-277]|uniref:hypothetical protein n=1 Tax=Paenibacillus sp. FSL R7-277 TaxID=1227352 RepID=UPI0003E2BD43|nr:hypothetical protein [Paenibacillus sp. FSL R7-277]ETT63602.1 hypothetical protein C173_24942 [Paenibacillus sp. FSL R7-277]
MKEDQFRTQYKKAVDTMSSSREMKQGFEGKMEQKRRPRKMVYIAASVLVAAAIGLAGPSVMKQLGGTSSPNQVAQVDPGTSAAGNSAGVVIPKIELPDKSSGAVADMIGLVVYQGNIYTQAAIRIEAADAAALRGEKLGRTTSGIDEWSGKDAYKELASNIGETDIYAVKGYDSGFLVMSYTEADGQVFAELYEHTNGITVNSGADLIGKLNLDGRIASAQWESFDSWNNGKQQYLPLPEGAALNGFLSALNAAKPLSADSLMAQGIYDNEDRKLVYLELADKARVELTLFGKGLVRYGNAPVFFEVEPGAFQALWDNLK